MNYEIISEIRNKLQAISIVLERMAEGQNVPEDFFKLAIHDFSEALKLFRSLPNDGKILLDFII
jgi:hypothetical protein